MPDLGTIRVGYLPIIGCASIFVTAEKGYSAEQGLQAEFVNFSAGGSMMAPLSTGQLDAAGLGGGTRLFNGMQQGLDFKVVSALGSEPPGYNGVPLLVRKDLFDCGEITEPADNITEGRENGVF